MRKILRTYEEEIPETYSMALRPIGSGELIEELPWTSENLVQSIMALIWRIYSMKKILRTRCEGGDRSEAFSKVRKRWIVFLA
jgi:hypothetical protein